MIINKSFYAMIKTLNTRTKTIYLVNLYEPLKINRKIFGKGKYWAYLVNILNIIFDWKTIVIISENNLWHQNSNLQLVCKKKKMNDFEDSFSVFSNMFVLIKVFYIFETEYQEFKIVKCDKNSQKPRYFQYF